MGRQYFISVLLCLVFHVGSAVIPNAILSLPSQDILGRMATAFGSSTKVTGKLARPPKDNNLLCHPVSSGLSYYYQDRVLLVPRGNCTFELKALHAQQAGATGIIIYNTLESRYRWNDTDSTVGYPRDRWDYDCQDGRRTSLELQLDPPRYNSSFNEFLTEDNSANRCFLSNCDSGRCLITGPSEDNSSTVEACCAWDLLMSMGLDRNLQERVTDIFAMFVTMEQGSTLLQEEDDTLVYLQERSAPAFNGSSILLWLVATLVTGFASWYSARSYRQAFSKISVYMSGMATTTRAVLSDDDETVASAQDENDLQLQEAAAEAERLAVEQDMDQAAAALNESPDVEAEIAAPEDTPPTEQEEQQEQAPSTAASRQTTSTRVSSSDNHLDLNVWHAVAFVVFASTLLLLLFYFEFYMALTVLYAIGCSGAVGHLIFRPIYNLASRKLSCCQWLQRPAINKGWFKGTRWIDIASVVSGYALGGIWLAVGFTSEDPMSNTFFWITQDVMGACLCILFLDVIRLSSIKVATALLVAAFIYDIFFVFLTPYIFDGESVMVTVATSGGAPNVKDENLCVKYPDDSECEGGDILPMVLTLPKINDYRGGATLLGLGDIVLPGLLIAFTARLDEAKRLAVLVGMRVKKPPHKWYHGYFLPLIAAYAVGLIFAYVAVRLMERGQPALLYIVPSCLGTMLVVGRKELKQLWQGPQEIMWADNLVRFCNRGFRSPARTRNRNAAATQTAADTTAAGARTSADGGRESPVIDVPQAEPQRNTSTTSLA